MRFIAELRSEDDLKVCRVYRDDEWQEYVLRFGGQPDADYQADCLEDALGTAAKHALGTAAKHVGGTVHFSECGRKAAFVTSRGTQYVVHCVTLWKTDKFVAESEACAEIRAKAFVR